MGVHWFAFVKPVDHRNDCILDISDCGLMPNRLIRTKVSLIQDFISDHCCCILPTSSEVKFFTFEPDVRVNKHQAGFKNQSLSI